MNALSRFLRVELPVPSYLAHPSVGIDISTSGIKIARLAEHTNGLVLADYAELALPTGTVVGGEMRDPTAVIEGLKKLAKEHHIKAANIALPESRGYLFEAEVPDGTLDEAMVAVERRLDEYVPLPAAEVAFAISRLPKREGLPTHAVGAGYSHRVVADTLGALDDAGIAVDAIESETFALPRALLKPGDDETALIIDIGKTTTKLLVATARLPRYVTTLDIGGHALTLAVEKHFGVSEEEAKRVKAERGIVSGEGNEEYLATMLSTVSVIRDEIAKRLEYWQSRPEAAGKDPVTRAILVGGNATVLGLPEYLESALKVPVELGDVFANFASRDDWLPPLEYTESLAYGSAIGLALRNYER